MKPLTTPGEIQAALAARAGTFGRTSPNADQWDQMIRMNCILELEEGKDFMNWKRFQVLFAGYSKRRGVPYRTWTTKGGKFFVGPKHIVDSLNGQKK